jgi:hypothetical protein
MNVQSSEFYIFYRNIRRKTSDYPLYHLEASFLFNWYTLNEIGH